MGTARKPEGSDKLAATRPHRKPPAPRPEEASPAPAAPAKPSRKRRPPFVL